MSTECLAEMNKKAREADLEFAQRGKHEKSARLSLKLDPAGRRTVHGSL